ncbi:acyl-CoA dehydrogenase family protein [Pseudonocardia sp. RS11V-5]|uniref:acyl-CoA dehydrogenase family protein n=1 Tax=Pseudonocardia terrae TaxID=2905831 RepID=UPI001E37E7A1|nr:acyl-CoA dehydrogenase family protein [Pseudonocardia terrae]MCE3551487.1 acyl-CoA dehydrogenase family protein [Pseudonocardia terrae]
MDFTFTEEQTLLRDSVVRALQRDYSFEARQSIVRSGTGWSPDVWARLVELGLTALPFPEDVGGLGGSVVDVVAVAEVFGEHLLVEPYDASIVLAGGVLAAVGRKDELERIASGEAIGALAHEEGRGTPDPSLVTTKAERSADGYALTGEKRLVLHGADADVLVVSARLDAGLALFLVDASAPVATRFTTVDGRRAAHLRFDGAPGTLLAADAEPLLRGVLDRAIVVLAAEAVGAMGGLLRRTAEYASTREQFGVPIGSFQTVAHRLADMKIAYVAARSTLLHTTALAEAGRLAPQDVAVLKAQVGRLGRRVGESAIQTHGGVGMTDELPIGHLHKRVLAVDAMFGGTDHHLRRLGAPRSPAATG